MLTSLYIHIPFCDNICTYCDFKKEIASSNKKANYISALIKELNYYKDDFKKVKTIYIGGGTPSSLELNLLENLFKAIEEVIDTKNLIEYSIETNPNDINQSFVSLITKYNVNRVSMGVQTFKVSLLKLLNRNHSIDDVYNAVSLLKKNNITKINIDMIFSIPTSNIVDLQNDLKHIKKLDVTHISYYSLILEEKTVLNYQIEHNKFSLIDEETEALMYNIVLDNLLEQGFNQYEISNFQKQEDYSYHNLTYWTNKEYLGIGVGAHSLFNQQRWFNTNNVSDYISMCENNNFSKNSYSYEELREVLMLGLRLTKGISITNINETYKIDLLQQYPDLIKYISEGLLVIKDDYLSFTRKGLLLGNLVFEIF